MSCWLSCAKKASRPLCCNTASCRLGPKSWARPSAATPDKSSCATASCKCSSIGAVVGIIIGLLLCWIQQQFGLVALGSSSGSFVISDVCFF